MRIEFFISCDDLPSAKRLRISSTEILVPFIIGFPPKIPIFEIIFDMQKELIFVLKVMGVSPTGQFI